MRATSASLLVTMGTKRNHLCRDEKVRDLVRCEIAARHHVRCGHGRDCGIGASHAARSGMATVARNAVNM